MTGEVASLVNLLYQVQEYRRTLNDVAAEFPPDANGDPDIAGLLENVRLLKLGYLRLKNSVEPPQVPEIDDLTLLQ